MTKYHARPTEVDGHRFASMAEARRYSELMLLQRAGEITDLELQPRYPLEVNGIKVATYVGDFRYQEGNEIVLEDVKSEPTKTPVYKLKKKLLYAIYGIGIVEVEP